MSVPHEAAPEPGRTPPPDPTFGLPNGYREGIVVAITFLLGFGLAFARLWAFAPGVWRRDNVLEGTPLLVGNALLLWALFRSLDPADEDRWHYAKTRHLLLFGVILMFIAVIVSALTGAVDSAPES